MINIYKTNQLINDNINVKRKYFITESNQFKAGQCRAITVILDAMKTHIRNAGVCEQGCEVLRNITFNGNIIIY